MRKTYGSYRTESCPFCGSAAYAKNADGIPVCSKHTRSTLGELTCVCGSPLEPKTGKWGAFYLCRNCGPVSPTKAMRVNPDATTPTRSAREETVRPDDPRYFSGRLF